MDLFNEYMIKNNVKDIKKRNMEYTNVGFGIDTYDPDRVRPINMIGNGVSDYGSVIQTGGLQYCEELYHRCDIVKKSIDELTDETLRRGLIIEPKFKKKCKYCGEYLNRDEKTCKCGNT
jgi:hypothetical protein